ncbi:hypothetical protein KFK09_022551 [Dendrobium nobile]|uniref:ER membrane protein complex subunit 10 n=1 Tax=Dendrobium nobile TaxID=94219 RepID=A0A8T3AJF6_DENNO|nr:hypothetical protein KFK09_022551 [Dendrobium nobile]
MKHTKPVFSFLFVALIFSCSSLGFQSDELVIDDEEFGIEGGRATDPVHAIPTSTPASRRRVDLDSSSDSKSVQFTLEHAFGDSAYSPAGTFTVRLKTWSHGGKRLLEEDNFYTIRVPSNVLNPPGKGYILSSVPARCIPRESLDEHFVIHTDGVDILALNYGSAGSCQYPRPLKFPKKWSFNSYTVMKNSEQARRTPTFTEELLAAETGEEEALKAPERSFWSKYWMYLIPLGLIVMNAITQAMNLPEEQQLAGQSASQAPQPIAQRATNSAARRR